MVLYVLLGKNAVNSIGDGYFGYDHSINDAIRREFFNPQAEQFKPPSPDRAKLCGFQSAGADVEPNNLLVSIQDSEHSLFAERWMFSERALGRLTFISDIFISFGN